MSPDVVDAIDRIEPPDHKPDFWAGLDAALGEHANVVSLDVAPRPSPPVRAGVMLVAAAVLLGAIGTVIFFQRSSSGGTTVIVEPADPGPSSNSADSESDSERAGEPPVLSVGDDRAQTSENSRPTTTTIPTTTPGEPSVGDETSSTTAPATSTTVTTTTTTNTTTTTTTTVTPESGSRPEPFRVEAETMSNKTNGQISDDGWRLYSEGYIEDVVVIEAAGTYRVTVRAEGFARTTTLPMMELRIGDSVIGSTLVDLGNYRAYDFTVDLSVGQQPVRVSFTNDPNEPADDVDLIIDYVEFRIVG